MVRHAIHDRYIDQLAVAALLIQVGYVTIRTVDVGITCQRDHHIYDRPPFSHEIGLEYPLGTSGGSHGLERTGCDDRLHSHRLQLSDELVHRIHVPVYHLGIREHHTDGDLVGIQGTEVSVDILAVLPFQIQRMERIFDGFSGLLVRQTEVPDYPPYEQEIILGRLEGVILLHLLEIIVGPAEEIGRHHIDVYPSRDGGHECFGLFEHLHVTIELLELPGIAHAPDVYDVAIHRVPAEILVYQRIGFAVILGESCEIDLDAQFSLDPLTCLLELFRRCEQNREVCESQHLFFTHNIPISCSIDIHMRVDSNWIIHPIC